MTTCVIFFNHNLKTKPMLNTMLNTMRNVKVVNFNNILSNTDHVKVDCKNQLYNSVEYWNCFHSWLIQNDNANYDFFWVVDHKTYFNGNIFEFIDIYYNTSVDLISNDILPVTPDWYWYNSDRNILNTPKDYKKCFMPIVRFSKRLVVATLALLKSGKKAYFEILWPTVNSMNNFDGLTFYHQELTWKHDNDCSEMPPFLDNKLYYNPKERIALILRGHERNSFAHSDILDLIRHLSVYFTVDIFIHTWNVSEASLSWRALQTDIIAITKDKVLAYFKDYIPNVKAIMVENEADLPYINTNKISNSMMPFCSWQRMLHGIHSISRKVLDYESSQQTKYAHVINTRLDIHVFSKANYDNVGYNFIDISRRIYDNTIRTFLTNTFCQGIDNFYIMTALNLFELSELFYNRLEAIVSLSKAANQEYYVYMIVNMYKRSNLSMTEFTDKIF